MIFDYNYYITFFHNINKIMPLFAIQQYQKINMLVLIKLNVMKFVMFLLQKLMVNIK